MIVAKTDICGDVVEFELKDGQISGDDEQKRDLYFIVADAWNEPEYHIQLEQPYSRPDLWKCTYPIIGYDCMLNGEVYGYGCSEVEALADCIKRIEEYTELCDIPANQSNIS